MPTSHINTLAACQLLLAKCLIPAIGMLLKHFLEEAKKPKNATFFVLYSAKRICEKYTMAAE
jgi:hypothetical protein